MRDGSPFDCAACTDAERNDRNCGNRLGLPDELRAVEIDAHTKQAKKELLARRARKLVTCGGTRFYECPLTFISPESREMHRLIFLIDEGGHLLHEGGWGGQPYWLVEAYEIYKVETARFVRQKAERDQSARK